MSIHIFKAILQVKVLLKSSHKKVLVKNDKIVSLAADKESCTVILNKSDYIKKVNNIVQEGMQQGKYIETIDTTQSNLKSFQDFLYWCFKKSEHYDLISFQFLKNQVDSLQLQKHTTLHY